MELLRILLLQFLLCFSISSLIALSQDPQAGFISLDCGTSKDETYTDDKTGLRYMSDAAFVGNDAVPQAVSTYYKGLTLIDRQFIKLTSFPKGIRNCYTLKPSQGKLNKYLIRARFFYGNYDGNADKKLPQFDLHLGVEYWDTVTFDPKYHIKSVDKEIIHVPTSDFIHVCLVNTGLGTPFMSVLELRPFSRSMYATENRTVSLMTKFRFDIGSDPRQFVRYEDDVFDRMWVPFNMASATRVNTTLTVMSRTYLNVPPAVFNTGIVPSDPTKPLTFRWSTNSSTDKLYICVSTAEIQQLKPNETREFNVYINDNFFSGPVKHDYLSGHSYRTTFPITNLTVHQISLNKTKNSTLPPLINTLEVYYMKEFNQPLTDDGDVIAVNKIKSDYDVTKNWQGDPCSPVTHAWTGLKCDYATFSSPRIISMNLSSSGLIGEISPYISNLTHIQVLDLSNNNLTGPIPDFLSQLSSLNILNLSGNSFSGPIPPKLLKQSKEGSLSLIIDESCKNGSCKEGKKNVVVLVVASVVSVLVVLVLVVVGIILVIRRRKQRVEGESKKNDGVHAKNRRYTFAEIRNMTKNFENVLGKGGFGTVYYGSIDGNEVAVKMLSSSSGQGLKEFQAEANILMNVHHKNLTSLVGYCIEGSNIGIIYEYMAKGNLHQLLSGRNHYVSFQERLQIATDSAQGLEYLHHGCKPPIIHRDIKCANILLNEKFQAKIADFGLSRVFSAESDTHISTVVAGTLGYLDPDYYTSNRLTTKSDVFSFGVVVLEIVTGRPATGYAPDHVHIVHWIKTSLENGGNIRDVVDPRLSGDFETNSAWKVLELAMGCVSKNPNERPIMNEVVNELKDCLATEMARTDTSSSQQPYSSSVTTSDLESEPMAR